MNLIKRHLDIVTKSFHTNGGIQGEIKQVLWFSSSYWVINDSVMSNILNILGNFILSGKTNAKQTQSNDVANEPTTPPSIGMICCGWKLSLVQSYLNHFKFLTAILKFILIFLKKA